MKMTTRPCVGKQSWLERYCQCLSDERASIVAVHGAKRNFQRAPKRNHYIELAALLQPWACSHEIVISADGWVN